MAFGCRQSIKRILNKSLVSSCMSNCQTYCGQVSAVTGINGAHTTTLGLSGCFTSEACLTYCCISAEGQREGRSGYENYRGCCGIPASTTARRLKCSHRGIVAHATELKKNALAAAS